MDRSPSVELTETERKTAKLKARFGAHISEWWSRYDTQFRDREFNFHIEDGPFELWSCDLSNRQSAVQRGEASSASSPDSLTATEADRGVTVWLLWDKKEVRSYDIEGEAYTDLINSQKALRLESKWKYYTSPLTVSAFLAVFLLILIFIMELCRYNVPEQLWSIFTAVIAFYFGKESSRGGSLHNDGH